MFEVTASILTSMESSRVDGSGTWVVGDGSRSMHRASRYLPRYLPFLVVPKTAVDEQDASSWYLAKKSQRRCLAVLVDRVLGVISCSGLPWRQPQQQVEVHKQQQEVAEVVGLRRLTVRSREQRSRTETDEAGGDSFVHLIEAETRPCGRK